MSVFSVFSQKDTLYNSSPQIILDFQLVDYNFLEYASKTVSNGTVESADYFRAYANPSMSQSLNITASVYNVAHYGFKHLNINWFKKDFLNYLAETSIWASGELVLMYMPLGGGWLHEEYHRAMLTKHYTNSFNDMNTFPLFAESVSVNSVKDDDLIRFKAENNADFVRLHAAGIEGEYVLAHKLQKQNFFHEQKLRYFSSNLMSIANSISYVWICSRQEAEDFTNDFLAIEMSKDIAFRDFTGLDFNAWVYDLFRPNEPYEKRGVHPSGWGIDRYIKPSDLTNEELKYLKKQGYLQLWNLASPMLLNIDNIYRGKKDLKANFAIRNYLTSFGHDLSPNFFLKTKNFNWIFAYHHYRNYKNTFAGAEIELYDYPLKIGNKILLTNIRTMAWLQPKDLSFTTSTAELGGLFDVKLKFSATKNMFPYVQVVGKTNGWVAGEVFQEENFSVKAGLSFYLQ